MRHIIFVLMAFSISGCGSPDGEQETVSNLQRVESHFGAEGYIELSIADQELLSSVAAENVILYNSIYESPEGERRRFRIASFGSGLGSDYSHLFKEEGFEPMKSTGDAKAAVDDCIITFREDEAGFQRCINSVINEIVDDCDNAVGKPDCATHCWLGDDANKCR